MFEIRAAANVDERTLICDEEDHNLSVKSIVDSFVCLLYVGRFRLLLLLAILPEVPSR